MFQLFKLIIFVIRVRLSDASCVPFIIRLRGKYRKNKPYVSAVLLRNFPFLTVKELSRDRLSLAYPRNAIQDNPLKTQYGTFVILFHRISIRFWSTVFDGRSSLRNIFSLFVVVINFERPKNIRGFRLKLKNICIYF